MNKEVLRKQYLEARKDIEKKDLLILLPSVLTLLVCIASPLDNSFRYAIPIIFQIQYYFY